MLYLMYLIIVLLTIVLFVLIKDRGKALMITGVITLSSALLLVLLTFVVRIIINSTVTSINISTIISYLFSKFLYSGVILLLIGIVEILLSKYIYSRNFVAEKKT